MFGAVQRATVVFFVYIQWYWFKWYMRLSLGDLNVFPCGNRNIFNEIYSAQM